MSHKHYWNTMLLQVCYVEPGRRRFRIVLGEVVAAFSTLVASPGLGLEEEFRNEACPDEISYVSLLSSIAERI
jgi:hypothetical protein